MAPKKEPGGCVLPLSLVVWAVCVVAFAVLLLAENRAADCPVPHFAADSTYGVRRWRWWPPGSSCVLGSNEDVPATAAREWDQPQPWRGVLGMMVAASGLGLIYAFRRSEKTYESL